MFLLAALYKAQQGSNACSYTVQAVLNRLLMFAGAEKMSWLLEMEGYSPKNSPPFAVTKSAITVLQNHYPERLGHAVLVKPPCIFNLAWNAFYPFLDRDTRSKIIFVKCGVDVVKSLKGVLDLASIDRNMGGLRNGEFDLAQYRERMIKLQSRQQNQSQR